MGRLREYANATERKRANRRKHAQERLRQIPQVHGVGYDLYQGDAVTLVPLLSAYDHVITDPPYEAEAHVRTRRTRAYREGRVAYAHIDFPPITEAQRRVLGRMVCGWILVFCQVEAVGRYQELFGTKYRRGATWVKPDSNPQQTGDRPAQGTESIVCAWGKPGRSVWNGGGARGVYDDEKRGVYRHTIKDGEARVHATQKPVTLLRELLRDFTEPGETVLDPFMDQRGHLNRNLRF
jgi:site-specific DNA-methyltransferase (adenine-specific)